MVIKPGLLLVYVTLFLVFPLEKVSAKQVASQTPNLSFLKSWLPEKQSPKLEKEAAALLKFDEKIIKPAHELYFNQQMETLVQKIGEKYTSIVLLVSHSKVEVFRTTLTTCFLQAISAENRIRRHQNVNLVKVYLHIPVKSFLDRESLEEIQFLAVALVNYVMEEGNINGVIFETSLIQNPIPSVTNTSQSVHDAVDLTVKKFKKFMKALELTFGRKLELGLSVNSLEECESSVMNMFAARISNFDMAVYNHGGTGTCQNKTHFGQCMILFQNKFPGMKFHKIQRVYDVKVM